MSATADTAEVPRSDTPTIPTRQTNPHPQSELRLSIQRLGGVTGATPMHWRIMLDNHRTYLQAAGLRPLSIKTRMSYIERAAADLPAPPDITTGDLLRWLAAHDWAPETRKSARSALINFFRWAHDFEGLPTDPARRLPAVRVPKGVAKPAPTAIMDQAFDGATERDTLLLMLAAFAGLRRSEIAALRWVDVQPTHLRVHGKGGVIRHVPLMAQLNDALEHERALRAEGKVGTGWRYKIDPGSPYVFPSVLGGHMHPDSVGPLLKELLGEGWTGHTLRHRFATRAYAGTNDLRAVQELLGHSKPETTARYVAVDPSALIRAVDAAA